MIEELLKKDSKYCSQGDTSSKHIPKKIFSSANGCFLTDMEGNFFLDMQMFNSAANFGYQNEEYNHCLEQQLYTLPCLAAEFMNVNRITLSEKICDYMLKTYNVAGRVHFTVGGAQAVDDALKLAINYTKSSGFFTFEGSYHGRTMAASSVSSSYRYVKRFGNVIDTYKIPFPNCSSCAYGMDKNCDLYCAKQVKRLFESEFLGVCDVNTGINRYAAFLFESVLGRGGYVYPQDNYFHTLTEFFKQHNIINIADEVQMGFYRTGKMWSFEHYNIVPDIMIFGKSVTNGLWPLSGIWAREDIISPEIWPMGSTHCTFAGHPLGTALGRKTFEILEDEQNLALIKSSEKEFEKVIHYLSSSYEFIHRAQVKGHAAGLDFFKPGTNIPATEELANLIHMALYKPYSVNHQKFGLILTAGGLYNNSLMLSPSLFIDKKELELFVTLMEYYIKCVFRENSQKK